MQMLLVKRVAATSLAVLSMLAILPAFFVLCLWLVSLAVHTSLYADILNALLGHAPGPGRGSLLLLIYLGPFVALVLLAASVVIEQRRGVGALPVGWRRVALVTVGGCFFMIALALLAHVVAG